MKARALHSTVTADARLRLSLDDVDLGEPGPDDVIVRVDAAPINPTDLYLMLSMAALSRATVENGALVAPGAGRRGRDVHGPPRQAAARRHRGRGDRRRRWREPGRAGARRQGRRGRERRHVRDAPQAARRRGSRAPARAHRRGWRVVIRQPDDRAQLRRDHARRRPSRARAHRGRVQLGQMLVRICAADGVPLVNIVRRPAQVEQLRGLGAEHVVDSSAAAFTDDLVAAIDATGATLAFDAIGGGSIASQILGAMERACARHMTTYSHYGSSTHKQLYIYGSLDRSPTTLVRTFGLAWSIGGYLVSHALRKLGTEVYARMTRRVMAELTTTFASHYQGRITLAQMLDADLLGRCAQTATGEKYLVTGP